MSFTMLLAEMPNIVKQQADVYTRILAPIARSALAEEKKLSIAAIIGDVCKSATSDMEQCRNDVRKDNAGHDRKDKRHVADAIRTRADTMLRVCKTHISIALQEMQVEEEIAKEVSSRLGQYFQDLMKNMISEVGLGKGRRK